MKGLLQCVICLVCLSHIALAQSDVAKSNPIKKERYKIALLTPVYLDSYNMKAKLLNLPKYAQPGIDFYQGAMIAADTLDGMGNKFDLFVHDSKSGYTSLKSLTESGDLNSMDVIIGNVGGDDLKLMADFAKSKQINFISAISPSDAKQDNNPYFTMLQPRLKTHVEKIHKHINYKFPNENVLVITRNIQNEINAKDYYINDKNNQGLGKVAEWTTATDIINVDELKKKLEPGAGNIIVLTVMDPVVVSENLKKITPLVSEYKIKVYGMPTWESMKSLKVNTSYPNLPVYYTTPFIVDKITTPATFINESYKARMGSGPASDLVYKGFESVYFASQLLKKYGSPITENQKETALSFLTPFRIVPIKEAEIFRFYENTFLYMVKNENGIVTYE